MKRKRTWMPLPVYLLVFTFIFVYSMIADVSCKEKRADSPELDSLKKVAEFDSAVKASQLDSIKLAKRVDSVPVNTATHEQNCRFDRKKEMGNFHHAALRSIHIYPEEIDTTGLVAMTTDYAVELLQLQQDLDYYHKGRYFYYSIEDTTRKGYDIFTILHYRGEEDAGLYLVFIRKDGKHSDAFEAAECDRTGESNSEGPEVSIGSTTFLPGNRMSGDDYYSNPIDPSDEVYDAAGRKAVTKIGHYQFQFIITEDGIVVQKSMIENDELLPAFTEKYRKLFHLSSFQ